MMSAYSKELLLNEFVIPEDPEENSEPSSVEDFFTIYYIKIRVISSPKIENH